MVGNDSSRMMSINISMEINSKTPITNIFVKEGTQNNNNFDGVITAELLPKNDILSFGGNQFVEFVITFSVGVASGVVGNYIYNAIHKMTKKIEINGRRTRLTEEGISQAIETIKELLEEEKRNKSSEEK